MKKRFCNVCEGGIKGRLIIGEYELRQIRKREEISFDGKTEAYYEDIDICQSCIIEAIGKLWMKDQVLEDGADQCIHGTAVGNECRECMKDERDQLEEAHALGLELNSDEGQNKWRSIKEDEDEGDQLSVTKEQDARYVRAIEKTLKYVHDSSEAPSPDNSYPVDKREAVQDRAFKLQWPIGWMW